MTGKRRSPPPRSRTKGLVVRKARLSDRAAILEMSSRIWGGTDYLPLVWDRWLADKNGTLLTVTLGGKPVGVSKVTLLGPREVWLEGLRLDPTLHGQGLSRQINRGTFRAAMKFRPRSIRYATGTGNAASRRLAEKRGFWLVARGRWMFGPAEKGGALSGRAARPNELQAVWQFVRSSECLRSMSGLCGVGWRFPELTVRRMRSAIAAGRVLVLPRRGRVRAVAVYDIAGIDGDVCLGFVDGPDKMIAALARDMRKVAGRLDRSEAAAMLPVGRIADVVRASGYDLNYPSESLVYELCARGFRPDDEPFDSVVWRTLRTTEEAAARLLVDLLMERSPRPLARENVRDFVMRHILPDTPRESMAAARPLADATGSDALREIHKGLTHHLTTHHGLAGEALHVGRNEVSFWHRGKRLAAIRMDRDRAALKLSLGPGFGACFGRRIKLGVERSAFLPGTRDRKSGRYAGLTLWLANERELPGAFRAIDIIMKSATRER
jgi:hypothetical protein